MRGLNPETKGTSVANYALVEFKSWSQAQSAIINLMGYVLPFDQINVLYFNANVPIAIGSAIPTEAVAPTTSELKKASFLSQYPQEDTQKTLEFQETRDLLAPAVLVPTDDQPIIETIVKSVEEDTTNNLQTETQDFENAEETAEDVSIVQASIGALEAMVDVEKVELNLASAATEIKNVTKKVEVIKSGSIKQDDRMDHVITRISKLEKTLLDLVKEVDMTKGVVVDKLEKCGSCKKPKRYEDWDCEVQK
ncbi:hypothetical protein HDU76_006655, partial [Blyttiomyces sp. JEL0837]